MTTDNASNWIFAPCKVVNEAATQAALKHQSTLTKPAGSLGKLESLAVKFAGWQASEFPRLDNITVRVFAADHGVCAKGVSAFPQVVTAQMVANFADGGAAICVLSRQIGADFAVVNLGTVNAIEAGDNVIACVIAPGTGDFSEQPAMNSAQLAQALMAGKRSVEAGRMDLFIGGEMGIGNTTSASALYSALLDLPPEKTVGPGTGVDRRGVEIKCGVIDRALSLHSAQLNSPLDIMRCLGGFEIAALSGAYIACAQRGIPALVDGFIATAAALVAVRLNPGVNDWLLFSHRSAEPAHVLALQALRGEPLLDLGMRLGEGSGAAVAVPILQSALNLHRQMATFEQASVSDTQVR